MNDNLIQITIGSEVVGMVRLQQDSNKWFAEMSCGASATFKTKELAVLTLVRKCLDDRPTLSQSFANS